MLPAEDIRSNRGTWALLTPGLPALSAVLLDYLPKEPFDPAFQGQHLQTYYFDTPNFDLRKARRGREHYLTLRIRSYGDKAFALSAKTEDAKFRCLITPAVAQAALAGDFTAIATNLHPSILARLLELTDTTPVRPVVCVKCQRYAVEDDQDRITLDVGIHTDNGKHLSFNVLEFKSTMPDTPPAAFGNLNPIKLSKFLWATEF